MRIISGRLGSRQFNSPASHRTHPMSDKIRGAIFNALGDVEGMTVLDAFAGSGALGLEALSRGARSVVAIEVDKLAHRTIIENAKTLGLHEQLKAIRSNAGTWSINNPEIQFDIVMCDPPYDQLQPRILQEMAGHVAAHGTYVLSYPATQELPEFIGLRLIKQKNYGDAQLAFYKSS